jgi:hypothetical protein
VLFGQEMRVNWAFQSHQREDTSNHWHVFVGDLGQVRLTGGLTGGLTSFALAGAKPMGLGGASAVAHALCPAAPTQDVTDAVLLAAFANLPGCS